MRRSHAGVAMAVAVLLAACSSDKKSIIDSGDQSATPPTTVASTTGAPTTSGSTVSTSAAGGGSAGTSAGGAATTAGPTSTAAPTTTLADLSAFPTCAPDALASATGPVKITVWHGLSGPLLSTFETQVAEYNASQTKVQVDVIGPAGQGDGYEQVIDKYLQSDQEGRPDVVQMPEYMVQNLIDTKSTVPAAACIRAESFDTSQFIPGALRAYSAGGVQWGLPFNVSDPVLFYNKKAFAAAGLDPNKPPSSLQELRAYSQQIVSSGASTFGLAVDSGFDSGGGWYIEQWFAQLGKYYADNDNGRSGRATKVLYDDPVGVDLLTQLQSMVNDKLAIDVGDNTATGFDNLLQMGGKDDRPAAMTIATSASLTTVLNVLKGGQYPAVSPDDVGVAPMPGPDGARGAIVGGAALWLKDSGDPAKIAASWDFEKFMVSAAQQSQFSADTGYVAVRNDARDIEPLKTLLATDPRYAVALDQIIALGDAPTAAGPVLGPLREVRTVLAQEVAQIFDGDDVKTSLDEAANQADALISSYNQNNG